MNAQAYRSFSRLRRGFSMVELLAVVGIISVMAVIIAIALSGGGETIAVGNGQRVAASVFQSARSNAVLRQTPTRVVIYASSTATSDSRKYLRYMGVVYLREGGNPNTASDWEPANQGTYLPEGVFFIPGDSSGSPLNLNPGATSAGIVDNTAGAGDILGSLFRNSSPMMTGLRFPVNVTAAPAENWYYYQFDANGMSENPGATFVIVAGRYNQENPPHIAVENPYATAGFAIRRIGGLTLFSDYDEIRAIGP